MALLPTGIDPTENLAAGSRRSAAGCVLRKLFVAGAVGGICPDGKTFCDAVQKESPDGRILAAYRREPRALRRML